MQLQFQNFQNHSVMQLQFFFSGLILHKYSVEGYSEDPAFVVEGKKAYPVRMIDDCVKHTCREHHQDANHLANLGTDGQRKSQLRE